MTILSLIKRIPSYASDVKININSCFEKVPEKINKVQLYGIALTAAYTLKQEELLNDIRSEAKIYLEEADAMACKIAVIDIAARAILNSFATVKESREEPFEHGMSFAMADSINVEDVDIHLYYLTAATLLRCDKSVAFCIERLNTLGLGDEEINFVVKLAATLDAAEQALDIETLRSYDFITRESSF